MNKSFTLIELIVVIAIIAILAAIIAPNAFKAIEKAKISRAIADLRAVKTALLTLYTDTGHWPVEPYPDPAWQLSISIDSDLYSNLHSWQGWDGPYLEKQYSSSPWGGSIAIQSVNEGEGPEQEILIEYDDDCVQSANKCPVPIAAAEIIDQKLDDGNTTILSGNIWVDDTSDPLWDLHWIIVWDIN